MSVFSYRKHVELYEQWFKEHDNIFSSEVDVIKSFVPSSAKGIEIGVGTGLFARELGIKFGNDPSAEMLEFAKKRGIVTYNCKGDSLPFDGEYFDYTLMVTTICFLENVEKTLNEIYRVTRKNGNIIVAFVDKDSIIGKSYLLRKDKSLFYKDASFYSTNDVINFLNNANFSNFEIRQTLFGSMSKIKEVQNYTDGYGDGSFVVIRAKR